MGPGFHVGIVIKLPLQTPGFSFVFYPHLEG